jgi:hypothetical protein
MRISPGKWQLRGKAFFAKNTMPEMDLTMINAAEPAKKTLITISDTSRVSNLKELVLEECHESVRLIHSGKLLEDSALIAEVLQPVFCTNEECNCTYGF